MGSVLMLLVVSVLETVLEDADAPTGQINSLQGTRESMMSEVCLFHQDEQVTSQQQQRSYLLTPNHQYVG